MSNINQYNFNELENAEILITEDVFTRLVSITNLSGLFREEHMCFLRGKEFEKNKIYFDEVNQNTDYIISGSGSSDPYAHGVKPGEKTNLSKEIIQWVKDTNYKNVLCDVHTHPSGISDGIDYRFFSGGDLESNIRFTKEMKEKGIQHIAGLVSVDNEKGMSTISFVWFDEASNRFYRILNVSIARYNEQENDYQIIRKLPKDGNLEFIELGFDQKYLDDEER